MDTQARARTAVLAALGDTQQRELLSRYLHGELSAEMTLMYWLQITGSVNVIQTALETALAASVTEGAPTLTQALAVLAALTAANHGGCDRIAGMLNSGVDSDAPAANVEEGIQFCKRLFDWSVEQCAEASVALYSLGNPRILAAATAEIVAVMRAWGLLGSRRRVLEIGCGIGRFQEALSPEVARITGIDVSTNMIATARQRCRPYTNVTLQECSGRDLTLFDSASFDFVFAVDSFPYLNQSGASLVEKHFSEVHRVLQADGDFLILEFSYRKDIAADRRDVRRLAASEFDVVVDGRHPFKLWDGATFHLRARPAVPYSPKYAR